MTKFLKKSKKPYFWVILGPFYQIFGKNEFSWKKGLYQFLNISIIIVLLCQKSERTNEPFLRKRLNSWTDRETTVILQGPPQDEGPIIKTTLSFPEFISKHQKRVYSINSFMRCGQFQSHVVRVAQPFMTMPTLIFFNQLLISMNL